MLVLQILGFGLALTVFYVTSRVIYNLFIHPLARYPGPKLAAISDAWYCKSWISGEYAYIIDCLHLKYGDVVRIAPNELSISTVPAAKDIYGHASKGRAPFLKSEFYAVGEEIPGIVSERNPQKHQEVRRSLSHAFSAKALRLQTNVVIKYVDMFVKQIEKFGSNPNGLRIDEWYNWLTFDIIGDLAFGEPFGAVAEAKTHFWISLILNSTFANSLRDVFKRFPLLALFAPWLLPDREKLIEQRKQHRKLSLEKVQGRIAQENTRDDFFAQFLSEKRTEVGEDFLTSQASTLIIAGSETTATTMAGVTYYLLRHPHCLNRLKKEVREAFQSSSDIDGDSTLHLPYISAVIEEALRIYPPVPIGLPRISPGIEVDGNYIPAGTVVSSSLWFLSHSPKYWFRPHEFHPERWLNSQNVEYDPAFSNDNKEAFKVFSQGPRVCIGINLAYMELRIILAKLVWHFDWHLVAKDIEWNRDSKMHTLWTKPALMVRMTPRAGD